MPGIIGKLLLLIAIVATAASGLSFLKASADGPRASNFRTIGRAAWLSMTAATVAAFGLLMWLSITHRFEYAYIVENTSRSLSLEYLISAAWAGQEGSFLLWIVMNGLVGGAVIKFARDYEAPVMAIIALCQFFLVSMIVGLQLGPLAIGSSPFATVAERFPNDPLVQAGITPADGQGLNDLLQNYWMVIHPPVLFSGFASMIVPFAFAVTALWKRRYTQWVRPALPWTLFAVMALGVGIILGGYWAYETLSFGGYWAWDPVENSSLVPWLVGIAAVHTMIVQKRSGHSQKASIFLAILAYMLVIYSTFLTRSGILGDISVHSFVDLGLYNQLLLWILSLGVIGFGLFAARYRELPAPEKEPKMLSREFMIFMGAMILCAIAAVVLVGTSAPILGRLFRDSPSAVPLEFYNKWSLPLTILFVFLAGLGQLFWWNRMSVENINRVLLRPVVLAVISTSAILVLTPFRQRIQEMSRVAEVTDISATTMAALGGLADLWMQHGFALLMLLLTFVAFFALFGNGIVLLRIIRGNTRLAGGAASHVGLAVMLLGIIASSGFSRPVARGTGVQIGESRDNFVVTRGETRVINGYTVTYTGRGENDEGRPTYELDILDPRGRSYRVDPVVYRSNRGQWIQHPDVTQFIEKDLFVSVAPNAMFDTNGSSGGGQLTLSRGDSVRIGNDRYMLQFAGFDLDVDDQYISDSTEVAVAARLLLTDLDSDDTRELKPVYLINKDRSVSYVQNTVTDWDVTIAFTGMNVDDGSIDVAVQGVDVLPEDWVVVQAYEKPFINLVWIGFIMLTFGFGIAIVRRASEQRFAYRRAEKAEKKSLSS